MKTSHQLLLMVLVYLSASLGVAQAQQTAACYDGVCYPSLPKAEAAMRATPVIGPLLRQVSSRLGSVTADSATTYIKYEVPDQPPEKILKPGFLIGGSGVAGLGCAPSESYPKLCSDEGQAVAKYLEMIVRNGKCPVVDHRISGGHVEPFKEVSRIWGPPPAKGILQYRFSDIESRRYLRWRIQCPGWDQPDHEERKTEIIKQAEFECPIGFYAKIGWAPGHAPNTNGAIVEWPNLCQPSPRFKEIRVTVTQVQSCSTAHPCHPSTGDKSRAETDFSFAGSDFVRSYHSLKQFSGESGSAPGWIHSYEERLEFYSSQPSLVTETGDFETYTALGGGRYVGRNSRDRLLEKQADSSYLLYDAGRSVKKFDGNGRLLSVHYPDQPGRDVELVYENNLLSAVLDATGRSLLFDYDHGLVSRVHLPDGATVAYDYDDQNNLISVDYGHDSVKRYHYHEDGLAESTLANHLTGISSENGERYASFGYDADGRVVSSALHAGNGMVEGVHLDYVSDTQVKLTTATQNVRTYSIQPGLYRRVLGISDARGATSNTYYPDGRRKTSVDADGDVTAYEYTSAYLAAITEAQGTANEKRTTFNRDSSQRMTGMEVLASGANVSGASSLQWFAYDQHGHRTHACSVEKEVGNANGYMCGSETNAPAGVRQSRYLVCEQPNIDAGTCPLLGLLTSVNGPRTDVNDVTTYTYYPSDDAACEAAPTTCPHRKGDLWKVTNALGQVTETLRYDGAGRPLSVKDANGVITEMEYHPRGWLAARKVRGSDGASETDDAITTIEYAPTGLVTRVIQPDGSFTRYDYDAAHRLTGIADGEGNRIDYTLDNAGNRVKEDTRDSEGSLLRTLSSVYNQLGQLQTARDAYDHATGFTYDANGDPDTVTDAHGRVTDNDHDPLGRLSRSLQDVAGIAAETKFSYDALDRLTKVTDPKGLDTTYQYDAFSGLTRLDSPDTGVTTYTYDEAGNRASATDARGKLTVYTYDALNRLAGVGYDSQGLDVAYLYDASNNLCPAAERFSKGRLSKMQDGSGSTQYCYDRFGNVSRKVQVTAGRSFMTQYVYSTGNRLTALRYPDGTWVRYSRNTMGQIAQVTSTAPGGTPQVLLSNVIYYPFGPAAELTYGGGRQLQRSLNENYQPGFVEDTAPGGLSLGYEFDEVGNLVTLRNGDQSEPPLRRYGYDGLNRLTGVEDGVTSAPLQGYAYDATGNRTSATVGATTTPYTYPTDSHRLTQVGNASRTYDEAGNTRLNGSTGRSLTHDATGRLAHVKQGDQIVMNYRYNGRGEQVRRYPDADSPDQVFTLYDEAGHWLGDYDTTGAPIQQAIWLDDLPVGLLAGAGTTQQLYHVQADHLGTPRVVIDPVRDVAVWNWASTGEAFGNSAPDQDPDGDGNALVFDMRFPGQRFDAGSGLNYNYFRDYEAGTGRYVESDPVGISDGPSTYSYVQSNPLTGIDPFGLTSLWFNARTKTLTVVPTAGSVYRMTATSGKSNCDECTTRDKNKGPIPSGKFRLYSRDLSDPNLVGDLARNFRPDGGDWGDWRARLWPEPGTETFGRDGFFLHGGSMPGSAGCIDIGGGIFGGSQSNQLRQDIINDPDGVVNVHVR